MKSGSVLAGRYELIRPLGIGGMAVVWRAHDLVLDRDVAVKMLASSGRGMPGGDIRAEAMAAARVVHPHVAGVYDYGVTKDALGVVPFVVMELLDGTTLADEPTPVPPRRAYQICADVASALAAAHALGVVHRDVKPANVMVTSAGVKVFDFGIAARVGRPADDEPEEITGTPTYLAPERLLGGPVTPATDVYSLGILLFSLLMGRTPWPARSGAETVAAHLLEEPAPLPVSPEVPSAVANTYRRCLARDPKQRPTADEVASLLAEAALADAPRTATARMTARARRAGHIGAGHMRGNTIFEDQLRGGQLSGDQFSGDQLSGGPDHWSLPRWIAHPAPGRRLALLIGACALALVASHVAFLRGLVVLPASEPAQAAPPATRPTPTDQPSSSPSAPTSSITLVPAASSAPTPTPTPTSNTPPTTQTFTSDAGSVVAGCYGDLAYLLTWTAAPGYQVKRVERGPANEVSVTFRDGRAQVTMGVMCPGGTPVLTVSQAVVTPSRSP